MPDETIRCTDCGRNFTFTTKEQDFFNEKGFTPPKRCRDCRQAKKEQRGGGSGGSNQRAPSIDFSPISFALPH